MKKAEEFGRDEKVWISESLWSGAQVTMLWYFIWGKLYPFLRAESIIISNIAAAIDKIQNGKLVVELATIICRTRNYLKVIKFFVEEDKYNSDLFDSQ